MCGNLIRYNFKVSRHALQWEWNTGLQLEHNRSGWQWKSISWINTSEFKWDFGDGSENTEDWAKFSIPISEYLILITLQINKNIKFTPLG